MNRKRAGMDGSIWIRCRRAVAGIVAAAALAASLAGCGPDEQEVQQVVRETAKKAYAQGVRDGAKAVSEKIKSEAEELRGGLKERLGGKMSLIAIAYILGLIFGPSLVEWLRRELAGVFRIPPATQIAMIQSAYLAAALFLLIYSLAAFGLAFSTPVILLLAGTVYPFWFIYLPALRESLAAGPVPVAVRVSAGRANASPFRSKSAAPAAVSPAAAPAASAARGDALQRRKTAMSQIKGMIFLCVVTLMLYRILEKGIEGIL